MSASANINLKTVMEYRFTDLGHTGLLARWKKHQSVKSISMTMVPALPRDHCPHGTKEQLTWHLKDIEKKLIPKGKAEHNLIDKPLTKIEIKFKNSKKGKSQNSHKAKLSLNNLDTCRKNGCYILTIEGSQDNWSQMAPL